MNLRENMFAFTLDANEIDSKVADYNYLNCMCVWFTDLAIAGDELYCV